MTLPPADRPQPAAAEPGRTPECQGDDCRSVNGARGKLAPFVVTVTWGGVSGRGPVGRGPSSVTRGPGLVRHRRQRRWSRWRGDGHAIGPPPTFWPKATSPTTA